MDPAHRIRCFSTLKSLIDKKLDEDSDNLFAGARAENPWFTPEMVRLSFRGISGMLDEDQLIPWVQKYHPASMSRTIGIVMAGNIPLVGFHDLLCVLVSGHKAAVKLSSKDGFLMRKMIDWILHIEPNFRLFIDIREQLGDFHAIIATGSDNTSRYFEYYFAKYPHIIRKNRTSVAILTGNESDTDLFNLGHDVFDYYGLGCRNVSKLFLPPGYDVKKLLDLWSDFSYVSYNHKYQNNYDYHKSIFLVNQEEHLDTGYLLLKETEDLVSPISVVFYQAYKSEHELNEILKPHLSKIQCIVTGREGSDGISFGQTQQPGVWDYADGFDTMDFLSKL